MAEGSRFRTASRRNIVSKILIDGVSGSGKSLTSLLIARGIVGPTGRIGVLDTQNGQIRRYSDVTPFGIITLRGDYNPQRFIDVIEGDAIAANLDCLIIDSATHEWSGKGGCLELAKRANGPDDWKTVSPLHQAFLEAIVQAPFNVIVTCRTKTLWEYRPDERGRIKPYRIGTDAIQRQEFEYDFDAWFRLDIDHVASVEKSTYGEYIPAGHSIRLPGLHVGYAIAAWIDGVPLDVLPSIDGGEIGETMQTTFAPSSSDDDGADYEDDSFGNEDDDGEPEYDARADRTPAPNSPAPARTAPANTRGTATAASRPASATDQTARTTGGRSTDSPLPAATSATRGGGRSAGASVRPSGSATTAPAARQTPVAGRGASDRSRVATDSPDDTAADSEPITGEPPSEQCVTCGAHVFPAELYEVAGTSFKGQVLLRQSRDQFGGNVYCAEHYLVQVRKRRRQTASAPAATS